MQDVVDAHAQVRDDLPTPRGELGTWWNDHLRPLLDFKAFLRQRDTIVRHPESSYCTQAPYEGWKNPFEFALSAATLTFSIVAIIGFGFHFLFPDPNVKSDWISHALQTQIRSVNSQLAAQPGPEQRQSLLYKRSQLENDLTDHDSELTLPHEGLLLTVGAPLVVYFLGVFFPWFIRRRTKAAEHAGKARQIVYYYFTARTFWPMFFLVTGGSIYFFLLRYSLLSTYDEIPQTFPVSFGILSGLLWAVALVGGAPFVYAVFAGPKAFHHCAKDIAGIIGVTDAHARHAVYWGLIRSIVFALIAAELLTLVLFVGYTAYDTGSKQLQTYVGHSLSTI